MDGVDRFQRRHPVVAYPIAVLYKFNEDQGPYLAALLTYYGFLSLFPLLLLLASILGFVLQDDPELQARILDSALGQFPIIGDQLATQGLQGSAAAVVIGGLVATYGALGVAQALQNAVNVSWAVPRNRRPNAIKARGRSVLLILTAGLAVLTTTTLSVLGGSQAGDGMFSGGTALLTTLAAVLANTAVFSVAFRIASAIRVRTTEVLPGAFLSALVWQLLQLFGTAYVNGVVRGTSTTYGLFAVVLGLLAWIYFASIGIVFGIEVNVVRSKRLYPRALMTIFTDDVDLTDADRQSYAEAAVAQRHKGFQDVAVRFEHGGQNRTARRLGDVSGPDRAEEPHDGPGPDTDR
ncbi:MAG: YihY/virulence factor BrkB family protein [Ilumatobacteraceae bacterium]